MNNIFKQIFNLSKKERESLNGHSAKVVWLTGLSGSGKTTLANALETSLYEDGFHTCILDGDNLRFGLNKDLGFNIEDRSESVRRVGEVAKLFYDAGLIVIVAHISPFEKDRLQVRQLFEKDEFIEVYINTPLEICMERDIKGLYAKAKQGIIRNMTGIQSPYEVPKNPEIMISIENKIEANIADIKAYIHQ